MLTNNKMGKEQTKYPIKSQPQQSQIGELGIRITTKPVSLAFL